MLDGARQAPLSEADYDKLKDALHAMAALLTRSRNTEKTSAVTGEAAGGETGDGDAVSKRRRRSCLRPEPSAAPVVAGPALLSRAPGGSLPQYTRSMTAPTSARPGRNEPCHCGSGRKYKHCCLEKDAAQASAVSAEAAGQDTAAAPEATAAAPARAPKPETHQPWKATTSRGFIPRMRTPRKVGGS